MNKFTSMLSKTATKVKVKTIKKAPTIAIIAGLLGMGATVYLTYRATTKIEQDKREKNENLNLVEIYRENGQIDHEDGSIVPYSEEDAERDTRIYNCRFWVNTAKHVALPIFTFIVSGFLIVKGFGAKYKEAATMSAAVAGLTAQIADMKAQLNTELGTEKANDILLGNKTHTETTIDENGVVESKEVTTRDRDVSGYTFVFSKDTSRMCFRGEPQMDKAFIEGNQRRANWLLNEKQGHVLFNDILDSFEIKRVGYGCTDGSVETPGHTIVFDVDDRVDEDGQTYYIISVNLQGYIKDKI